VIRPFLLLPLVALLAACSKTPPEPAAAVQQPAAPMPKERAQAAAKEFSGTLKAALSSQLAQGGTKGAIAFCHDEAPKIAQRVGAAHGVRIGRVPVPGRQRSPANTPTAWQAEGMAAFQAKVATGTTPVADLVQVTDTGLPKGVALRMMRGIAVEPMCLACHGKAVAPATQAALKRHYPEDNAIGFDVGDLRGALWVEVPATP
jgi:hypothetical protein